MHIHHIHTSYTYIIYVHHIHVYIYICNYLQQYGDVIVSKNFVNLYNCNCMGGACVFAGDGMPICILQQVFGCDSHMKAR